MAIQGCGGAILREVASYKINIVYVSETNIVFRVVKTLNHNATNIVYQWQHVEYKLDDNLFIMLNLEVVNIRSDGQKTRRDSFFTLSLEDFDKLLLVIEKSFSSREFAQGVYI